MPHLSIVEMERYALKELSEAEMLRVEKHVARCAKCREHLDEELGWAAAIRSRSENGAQRKAGGSVTADYSYSLCSSASAASALWYSPVQSLWTPFLARKILQLSL
jgi:hypothetical protein